MAFKNIPITSTARSLGIHAMHHISNNETSSNLLCEEVMMEEQTE